MPMQKQSIKAAAKRREELGRPLTIIIVMAALLGLAYLYTSGLPLLVSIGLAIVILIVTGHIIARTNGLIGGYGLYLTGTQHGIRLIVWLSKRKPQFWELLTQWALVLGFGLLAYPLFKKQIGKRMFAFSILTLILINLFIFPWVALGLSVVNIPQITSRLALPAPGTDLIVFNSGLPLLQYLEIYSSDIIALIGGYSLLFIATIILGAISTLYTLSSVAATVVSGTPNYAPLGSLVPGVAPLIPGVTLPLISGLLALALLLIVHEFSHGVLASKLKIRLKMIGLILFGVVPIGAFVEPDEKQVSKLDKASQNKIFIAGIGSNLLLFVIFAIPTILMFLYVMPHFVTYNVVVTYVAPGHPASNILFPGEIIYSWNNFTIKNVSTLTAADSKDLPNAPVRITTNNGPAVVQANATGKIGIDVEEEVMPVKNTPLALIVNFLYNFFALSFMLNFLVGAINLMPVPSFDGWRIYKNIMSYRSLKIFALLLVLSLVILSLAWIWLA